MKKTGRKNREGFTLAEAVIATVVLGIAAAGVLLPFTSGVAVRAEGEHRTLGAKLASDLMEEIIKTPFNQIVTNYNYTELHSNYAKFSRVVTCAEAYVSQESGTGEARFILATVQVNYDGKEIATINRLISK